MCNMSVMRTKL